MFKFLKWQRDTSLGRLFKSFQEASRYYEKDVRTLKKYEKIYFSVIPEYRNIDNYKNCKYCKKYTHPSKIGRAGYCSVCTSKGLGKKQQGRIISKRYKGEGNPNYLHGLSKKDTWQSAKWYHVKNKLPNKCLLTGTTENVDYHHIIPNWFCKLSEIDPYCLHNILPVNHEYHKAIHHLGLDVLLLPNLYSLYKTNAPQLREYFLTQCKLHKLLEIEIEKYQPLCLFQAGRYPGRKKLLNLHPEFLQPFFDQKE